MGDDEDEDEDDEDDGEDDDDEELLRMNEQPDGEEMSQLREEIFESVMAALGSTDAKR